MADANDCMRWKDILWKRINEPQYSLYWCAATNEIPLTAKSRWITTAKAALNPCKRDISGQSFVMS
jgi:hypothetical protein